MWQTSTSPALKALTIIGQPVEMVTKDIQVKESEREFSFPQSEISLKNFQKLKETTHDENEKILDQNDDQLRVREHQK